MSPDEPDEFYANQPAWVRLIAWVVSLGIPGVFMFLAIRECMR